ncbi:MAG: carboxypeptidase regulatory-like domain-containing protein [Candidatus Sulfobium sp.]
MKRLIGISTLILLFLLMQGAVFAEPHHSNNRRDKQSPTVTVFTIPGTYSSLTVPITAFGATDNVGVTGYIVTQSSRTPSAGAEGWTQTAPSSFIFSSEGTKTLYAWARDAAGNVSTSKSATVTITLDSTGGSSGTGGTGGTTGSTSEISGVVRDIVTGAVISGAVVSDGTNSATTDNTGAYTLNDPAGNYTLTTSKSGYLTTAQVTTVMSGSGSTVDWALTKSYGNQTVPASNMSYVILAWNDLGMHCDQNDYSYFGILPPFNTLHAQVFRRGGEGAGLMTSGITVSYSFPKKTNSALHTNFWSYAPQFGWDVPTNVGITGTPISGDMTLDSKGLSWQAVGIPITPYDDDGTWDPYGTAVITVKDSSGNVLQTADVVAPVSTEMMCSNCHGTTNPQLDILQRHDALSGTNLVADQSSGIVHMCSECHSDNALGMPGKAGVESLSLAMHNFHRDKMNTTPEAANTDPSCFNCHPGPKTQCLRGIMARAGKTCADCHGDMNGITASIRNGRQPWIQEPQCGGCHDASHAENSNTLYRDSVLTNAPEEMGGKIYCEACHNGAHAEYTTANPADTTITRKFQGDNYWIWNCQVCHNSQSQRPMHSGGFSSSGSTGTSGGGGYDN